MKTSVLYESGTGILTNWKPEDNGGKLPKLEGKIISNFKFYMEANYQLCVRVE